MKRNLEQKRASYALGVINKRKKELEGKQRERYLNRAKGLPAMIIMCGLGQSVATLLSVGQGVRTNPDQMLYDDISNWICGAEKMIYHEENLIEAIVKNDREKYVQAQAEILKLLEWLKKFATAYLSQGVKENEATTL